MLIEEKLYCIKILGNFQWNVQVNEKNNIELICPDCESGADCANQSQPYVRMKWVWHREVDN